MFCVPLILGSFIGTQRNATSGIYYDNSVLLFACPSDDDDDDDDH